MPALAREPDLGIGLLHLPGDFGLRGRDRHTRRGGGSRAAVRLGGWLPDGRLLVVSMRDQKILRRESDGELVVHADLSGYVSANVNDMLVDAQGRAYVATSGSI